MKWIFLAAIFILISSPQGQAQERVGVLSVEELHIKTFLSVEEPQDAAFGFDESTLSLGWRKNENLSAHMSLGSKELIVEPIHFVSDANVSDELGLIEAYANLEGVYGRVRAGLVPIQFGVEGSLRESQLIMPRQLLFSNRVVGLRDLGVSFYTSHNGYYTGLTVHNGEGSNDNPDSRVFITSKFGWSNSRNVDVGLAAQTGTTKSPSTSTSGSTLAGIDNSRQAKWRLANLFVHWHPNEWDILIESYYGELDQKNSTTEEQFLGGHFDWGYKEGAFGIKFRYDQFDPNQGVDGDLQKQISLTLAYYSPFETSSFYVVGIKKIEENEGNKVNNDEIRFVWRLTPYVTR